MTQKKIFLFRNESSKLTKNYAAESGYFTNPSNTCRANRMFLRQLSRNKETDKLTDGNLKLFPCLHNKSSLTFRQQLNKKSFRLQMSVKIAYIHVLNPCITFQTNLIISYTDVMNLGMTQYVFKKLGFFTNSLGNQQN